MGKNDDDNIYLVSGGDYDDNCPICKAIKEGRTSLSELKEAFKQAKEKGAIVGGDFFEDKKN